MSSGINHPSTIHQQLLHQAVQNIAPSQVNIQGLLTQDGLLHPAFFNIAQSDLLKILDRLTQQPPPSRHQEPDKQSGGGELTQTAALLRKLLQGVGRLSAQARGLLFNQAVIDLPAKQLERLYLAAPHDDLRFELIDAVVSHGPLPTRSQLQQLIADLGNQDLIDQVAALRLS